MQNPCRVLRRLWHGLTCVLKGDVSYFVGIRVWKAWSQGEGTPVKRFLSMGENGRALVFSVEMEGGSTGDSICRYQRQ